MKRTGLPREAVLSAVFDNIPLTALALTQGGYDWGTVAYAVGFVVLLALLGWQPVAH